MVGTRMEGRIKNLEKEVGAVKIDVTEMKAWMLEMKDSLSNLEKKLSKGGEIRGSSCLYGGEGPELAQKVNNYEMLMALKQTGTMSEYREQFELISEPLKEAPEAMLIGAFQNGLNGEDKGSTQDEIARKRRLGECFTCDEKWNPSHKCKNKHLHVILLSDQLEESETEELGIEDIEPKEEEEAGGTLMSLSMNSIVGITSGRTMKLVGKVRGEVLIMIDCGASHNFISTSLVDKMALPKVKISSYKVTMGDGHSVQSEGKWDETIYLKGNSSLAKTEVSYKAVMRSVQKGGQGYIIELSMVEAQKMKTSKYPKKYNRYYKNFQQCVSL
ncbi:Hydroxymethylglutaryl-CoA lyase, mitochondrial [Senna tora]|uniref:Hydroxymethylglutaryl-CoA lyase, mitochondrial n=1 Tax=Senna tora TaxID=362788 RepID=A0A834X7V5_9FABA|nr:Hydroxymethylglutaryl-CoA lyase, mitochondrial [Senna tora]